MNIRLRPHQKIHIQSSSDIYQILQPIFRRKSKLDRDREHLWMMTLDGSQTVSNPGSTPIAVKLRVSSFRTA